MPQYIDPTCGVALGHRLTLPFTLYGLAAEDWGYTLGHQDYTVNSESGDVTISIKTGRFVDTVSAVNKVFEVTLTNLDAATYNQIKEFARLDYLYYLSNGSGNVSLDLDSEDYTGCYIKTPIQSSESIYDTTTGTELFQEVTLQLVRPSYNWY